jgi:hypothetical protein
MWHRPDPPIYASLLVLLVHTTHCSLWVTGDGAASVPTQERAKTLRLVYALGSFWSTCKAQCFEGTYKDSHTGLAHFEPQWDREPVCLAPVASHTRPDMAPGTISSAIGRMSIVGEFARVG